MKNLLIILILSMTFVSCKKDKQTELPKSDFNLKSDFTELTNKMTELDTIKIWTNLSQCMYEGIEKLKITRKGDSLKIQPEFTESMFVGAEYTKTKPIKISVNDTVWKFNSFLKRNLKRVNMDSLEYGRLQITLKKERINFMTNGLGDSAIFLIDYCNTMMNLIPESENHIYAGTEIIEEPELTTE
ncbi:hypothetical protein [Olleya sp. 1-3]|uniref:hypothetical protein n=1 Tax=Olleya sp. 1-3 TaxID=2058323 RepID=UPI0012FEFEA3|nr:hypothetical protein [Olleya sp. 1-3]